MVELKREYVVPLRKKTNLAPKWRRSKKAVSVLNDFIKKHMKTDDVVICAELNEKIWENGIKNPPGKVSVIAVKTKIAGKDKTIVNLLEVGVESHLKNYGVSEKAVVSKDNKKEDTAKVVDAKVSEVKKETKTKEVKAKTVKKKATPSKKEKVAEAKE